MLFRYPGCPFDVIVSNPPYIADAEFADLPPEISRFEPEGALRGNGPNGLDVIRRILADACRFLKKDGHLFIEIGKGQAEILRETPPARFGMKQVEFIKDYSDIYRVLHLWEPIG